MPTILVIDDDAAMRDSIRAILSAKGYAVAEAENGARALQLFQRERPALIITDILMPDKDGIETIRELRNLDPQIYIIAVSGGGGGGGRYIDFLRIAKEFGANEVLEKPFRRDALLVAVAKGLGESGA